MWRCDAGRTAASPIELPASLHLQWKRTMPTPRPAFPNDPRVCFDASYEPVVLGKRAFVPSMVTDSVTALDTETGEPAWTFFADGPVRFAPVAWEEKVYFVSDDGCLYCLSAGDGRLIWKYCPLPADRTPYKFLGNERLISRWPARGGPVLADATVYFAAGIWPCEGVFVCAVDARSGQARWVNKDGGLLRDALLDHGDRRDGGLSPQGYLAVIGDRLIVPCGRALPAFFDRKSGTMEPYTTGWGGRVALAKGCWQVCGTEQYLFQSGDVFALAKQQPPTAPSPRPGDLVSLREMAIQMRLPEETVARWVKDSRINTVDRGGEQFLRVLNGDPITYLSWWTYDKIERARAGERHALQTRPRLQIDPANAKELGVFRDPVVTGDTVYYSCPKTKGGLRLEDEDRLPAKSADYSQIVACRLDSPPKWTVTYQGGWGGRPVQWRVASFDRLWSLPSQLKVHLKAGRRLYAGGRGVVAAVDLPSAGGEPKVSWQAAIEGTPTRMLAADGKLFVVTSDGALYCFGPKGSGVVSRVGGEVAPYPKTVAADPGNDSRPLFRLLQRAGVAEGYCLVLGLGSGRLTEELARRSQLHVIAVDPNPRKIDAARRRLHAMALYGSRVHVVPGDLASLRLPRFMASLVVSEEPADSRLDEDRAMVEKLFACLRPYGGKACLPLAEDRHAAFARHVKQAKLAGAEVSREADLTILARAGALPDAADWPHESGDASHTFASKDRGARPPFGVLWFGGSLDRVVPCLDGAPPRIAAGRMFLRVGNELHGVDIYTGRHLWKRSPTGMSDFLAADDGAYVVSGKTCLRLDPATGAQAGQIPLPPELMKEKGVSWQQVRLWGDYLVGTAGKHLVCLDRRRGDLRWQRRSERGGFGLAVGANKVFCVDCWLPGPWRREEAKAEEGTIAAIDAPSGKTLWETAVAIPADAAARKAQPSFSPFLSPQLAFCEAADVLVFTRNRSTVAAYRAGTGKLLWSRDIPCKEPPSAFTGYHPPIVLTDRMVSHGGEVVDLLTGKPVGKRLWKGINVETRGCGRALGSPCLVTVRDGHISYFDLATGGHVYFRGIRSGCTNSLIAAGGILNAPNFARHCTCNYPLSVSLAFATMPEAAAWGAGH